MRIIRLFLFILPLSGGLYADGPRVLSLMGTEPLVFSVDSAGLYSFTLQASTPPYPELGVWEMEVGGRVLVGRNRDSSGYLSDRFELGLKAGRTYTLQQTSGNGKITLEVAPVNWSDLKSEMKAGLQPINRDLAELAWTSSAALPEAPRQLFLTGPAGSLMAVADSRGLRVYEKSGSEMLPLGDLKMMANWDSWSLGQSGQAPQLAYSFPGSGNLRSEARLEVWNPPIWQVAPPLPFILHGPVVQTFWKDRTYLGGWQLKNSPEFLLVETASGRSFPGPVFEGPVSSQYRLEPKADGLWAVFQTAGGTDRWHQIYRFDGKIWTSLDFPLVKNPRLLLSAEGADSSVGVVDPQGGLLLYRLDKAFWTTIPAPKDWVFDPRSAYFLTATPAGLTLFQQGAREMSYVRWSEGQWNQSQKFPGFRLWDVAVDRSGEGTAAISSPGDNRQVNFYRVP